MRAREANLREFLSEGDAVFGPEWLDVASTDTINLRLTSDQLHQIVLEIDTVLWKYIDAYKRTPLPGAIPVQLHINAFPLVRGASTEAPLRTRKDRS